MNLLQYIIRVAETRNNKDCRCCFSVHYYNNFSNCHHRYFNATDRELSEP